MRALNGFSGICLAGVIGALSATASPSAAAEQVSFKAEQLWPKPKATTITGTLSKPDGSGPFPAVVLLPNCGGPKTFEFSKYWPAYLNTLGYVTLNVDHFTPRKQVRCSKRFKPNNRVIAQDAYGALTFLATLPYVDATRVAVMGSSLGGMAINFFGGLGRSNSAGLTFKASVALYTAHCKKVLPGPGLIPPLIILGDKEKGAATCRALSRAPEVNVHVFTNTYHGFDQPSATRRKNGKLRQDIAGNKRLYSKSATEKAKALVAAYLSAKLSTPAVTAAPGTSGSVKLGRVGGKDPYVAVRRRDKDKDGRVSAAEWEKSPVLFSKIDKDGDGFITPQEFHDRWISIR